MFLRNIVSLALVFALHRVVWTSFCMISRRVALLVRVALFVRDITSRGSCFCIISRRLALLLRDIASFGLVCA